MSNLLAPPESSTSQRPQSTQLFQQAKQLMPGGVNSPVRAFNSVGGGTPLVVQRAEGPYLYDADGRQYIDTIMSWGPAIVGHAHPKVVEAVRKAALNGLSFGCPTQAENDLAELVIDRVPSIEKVRFVNSGTEAVMSAIRLARAATGRRKIIKFNGCYHGHADFLLVKAGSGASTLGQPDSAGVTAANTQDTLNATYNDLASVEALFNEHGSDIAGVIIEPVAGNMGCVLPQPGFLEGLKNLCAKHSSLLLFDEVMTGFRVAKGGAQAHYNVLPDITILGKVVGGGMPVGAYGARAELMQWVAPEGPMYQAGTLSGHPLGMVAGAETLRLLDEPGVYEALDQRTAQLAQGLAAACERYQVPHTVTQVGAMLSLFFTAGPVCSIADVDASDKAFFKRFFWAMFERGVYLAPSPYEAAFTSLAHTEPVIETMLERVDDALKALTSS